MKNSISWILRLLAIIILWQTLYFKFTAHPESVELFTKLGVEPWGRIFTGIMELIVGFLLFLPQTKTIGAFLGLGLMFGAIASHLFVIGLNTNGDGGLLFVLAIIVLLSCTFILILHWSEVINLFNKLRNKKSII
jgi:putative oxidoreductase